MVIDILTQEKIHFAYTNVTSNAAQDKWLIKRLTQQVMDQRFGPKFFRQICLQQSANSGGDAIGSSSLSASLTSPHRDGRGRKRHAPEMADIPLHPIMTLNDLAVVAPSSLSSSSVVDPSILPSSTPAIASSSATDALIAANGGVTPFQTSTRSQLTELVRVITELRNGRIRLKQRNETIYIVVDNVHRLGDPSLLSSLLSLPSQTQYPIGLILISVSLPSPHGGVTGYFGLPQHSSDKLYPIPFKPYTPKQLGHIIGRKLWSTNKFISRAFVADNGNNSSSQSNLNSTPSVASSLTPSQSSVAVSYFVAVIAHVLEVYSDYLSNDCITSENHIRRLLPKIIQSIQTLMQGKTLDSELAESHPTGLTLSVRSSNFSAKILQLLEKELIRATKDIWQVERETPTLTRTSTSASSIATTTTDASSLTDPTPRKKQAIRDESDSNGIKDFPSATFSLANTSSSSVDPNLSSLLRLSRVSKLLLLSSFLASYNPASSDTSLFTTTGRRWNRRGKSATIDKKRSNFDARSSETQAQVTLLQLGPNAATLERVIAIYQAIGEDDQHNKRPNDSIGGGTSLADCYVQLKNLIASHHLEQVTGRNKSSSSIDMLTGVKIRCLVKYEDMEKLCESIDPVKTTMSGATVSSSSSSSASSTRMGERITLNMYLYDGAKRK